MSGAAPPPRARGEYFPIPLVGMTAILLVLIVFTPILFATGPPAAGTFETQAELVVDQYPAGSNTTFYVHAVGPAVRYARIAIALAEGFGWTGGCTASALKWSSWSNRTGVLENAVGSGANPIAIRATATYTADGSTANYSAELVVDSSGSALSFAACDGATPPTSPEPIANLPLVLLLQDWGSGSPP